ncbi:GAF domain-containing protein [Thiohalocapsa marina]|uniref:Sensor protein n=1 Tax=Thiohalocapsa marina TaxID=424902 RepID=A0A5M8FRY2_9GAMM|nr:ATP-binding protein [Thiohalocapsa marina]KAA6184322.1 GAF domain-containing protein [Thiohalocapsa marina]
MTQPLATPARQGDRRILHILRAARLLTPLAVFGLSLLAAVTLLLLTPAGHAPSSATPAGLAWIMGWAKPVALAALLVGVLAALLLAARLKTQLLQPLVSLEDSVTRVCEGEPGASRLLHKAGVLQTMAQGIGSLNRELTDLYEDMDSRVARQTTRLAQKTASLKILYDVAAEITRADTLEDILLHFLRVLKEMVNGRAATVRLVTADGAPRLIGSIGLDDDLVREQDMPPVDLCLCGTVLCPGEIVCDNDLRYCSRVYGRRMFGSDVLEVVTVPVKHHDELLGTYSIFVDRPGIRLREDIQDLLSTIGQHIGVAVAKYRSDNEARRLSIIEERASLAHELHDSLAQTLASLRLQARMLQDSLQGATISDEARADLSRIRNGIDEAHGEVRELMASFRAPMQRRGLVPTLQELTRAFGKQTGVHCVFQLNCRPFEVSAVEEMQLVRIVQETLANVRKHARAQTVRVLLTREPDGTYVLLVEDDGVGFRAPEPRVGGGRRSGNPGEHIGLSILQERARRIGARLEVESEPGEGTRVEVSFEPARGTRASGTDLAA